MISRTQMMAQRAYGSVIAGKMKSYFAEYGRLCKAFPTLLHTTGLCQSVAFYQAKSTSNGAHKQYLDDLGRVMGLGTDWGEIRSAPLLQYRRMTMDATAAAVWLKRFAEAEIRSDDSTSGEVDPQ